MRRDIREGVAALLEAMFAPLTDADIDNYMGKVEIKSHATRKLLAERRHMTMVRKAMDALLGSGGCTIKDVATFLREPVVRLGEANFKKAEEKIAEAFVPPPALPAPVTIDLGETKPRYRKASPPADFRDWHGAVLSEKNAVEVYLIAALRLKGDIVFATLPARERDFVEDMVLRLGRNEWLTMRQKMWLDVILMKTKT